MCFTVTVRLHLDCGWTVNAFGHHLGELSCGGSSGVPWLPPKPLHMHVVGHSQPACPPCRPPLACRSSSTHSADAPPYGPLLLSFYGNSNANKAAGKWKPPSHPRSLARGVECGVGLCGGQMQRLNRVCVTRDMSWVLGQAGMWGRTSRTRPLQHCPS